MVQQIQRFIFKFEMSEILKYVKIKEFQILLQENHCIALYNYGNYGNFHVSCQHCFSIIKRNHLDGLCFKTTNDLYI